MTRHPHNRRTSSSTNLSQQQQQQQSTSGSNNSKAHHHPSLGFTSTSAAATASSEAGPSSTTSSAPANKRRQSSDVHSEDGQHHSHHGGKIGPKRKSKVGIHGMHHHGLHGMTRKNNASSSGLAGYGAAGHRKDSNRRSHASLANLANEIAAAYEADPAPQGMERTSSRGGVIETKQKGKAGKDSQAVTNEEDDGEGWISANSSTAVTPEAGTSPMSPESYKPLEISRKSRRGKGAAEKAVIPQLTFEKQEVQQLPHDAAGDEEGREAESGVLGTTPTQTSSLSRVSKSQSNLTRMSEAAQQASRDGGDISPSAEHGEDSGPPTPRLPVDEATASSNEPTSQQLQQIAEHLSPGLQQAKEEAKEQPSDLPPASAIGTVKPRLANLRKTSSSTIRSLTSMNGAGGGGGARPPLTSAMRKSTTPLQPALDTKTTCFGEILEQNLSPTEASPASFGAARNNVPFPSASANGQPVKPKRDRTISGNSSKSNAGTLTAQEAEDLARRLRSVSGTDLQGLEGGYGGYGARAALRRSASSTHGYSLSGAGPGSPRTEYSSGTSSTGGAFGTLKRASGYFGSIGRLTGLTGLTGNTSSGNLSNSPPSPVHNISPAQAALGASASSPALRGSNGPSTSSRNNKGKQVSISTPALQQQQQQQQQYRPPPLISKFIEHNTGSQMLFAKQPPNNNNSGVSSTSTDQQQKGRGTVSRARQKMLTQRDAPFPVSSQAQDFYNQLTPGRSSDEDPSSSASQLNLRAIHASGGGGASGVQSGQSTPLAQGVHRWLQALAKEMQRIDMDHSSNSRWRDELNASVARTLAKLEREEEEGRKEREKALREEEETAANKAGQSSVKS